MKLLAINGSPRKTMNTGSLLAHVVRGAEAAGAEAELIHLRDFQFRGCISCFHCKDPGSKHYGRCAIRDELTDILNEAHEADVLVLGSPFYFSGETSQMRAFMERLWFQYVLYTTVKGPLCAPKKATALVYTMNVRKEDMPAFGKLSHVEHCKGIMERVFGSCELFLCCDTKQFKDYSKYEVDVFDVPAKLKRHEDIFPRELEEAFELGKRLVG